MADPKVTIRMYRTGLGDCHLLSFTAGGQQSHILIDCGYFPGSPFPGITVSQIADDIANKTGNKLDALVVTHEHQDHLQGFMDAEAKFKAMDRNELWMAWTERPGQTKVAEKRTLAGLAAAASQLAVAGGSEEKALAGQIESLLGFSAGTDESFKKVKSWFTASKRKYWDPGDIIERPWLPGVRIYVLGPPTDLNLLHKTTGKKNVEMYELSEQQAGFAAAALAQDPNAPAQGADRLSPFDFKYARASLPRELAKSYDKPADSWRRIDTDWLLSAGRLALQLDSYTNNTSLVLAFELIDSGRVLLFVGDAQIGNWLSWQPLKFKVGNKTVTPADLLARTVFYKVGHHGSHNATLVQGGILAMTSGHLQAAIPTNEQWAKDAKDWEMPNANLFTELKHRCVGPVFRADRAPANKLFVQCDIPDHP